MCILLVYIHIILTGVLHGLHSHVHTHTHTHIHTKYIHIDNTIVRLRLEDYGTVVRFQARTTVFSLQRVQIGCGAQQVSYRMDSSGFYPRRKVAEIKNRWRLYCEAYICLHGFSSDKFNFIFTGLNPEPLLIFYDKISISNL